jgi:hypothetical protein
MATIYNSDLTKELIKGAKIQTGRDNVPSQIAEKVVPVMEVNPKLLKETDAGGAGYSLGSSTYVILYTTPSTGKDFYLTDYTFSFVKDVACDTASGPITLQVSKNGANFVVSRSMVLTLTAERETISGTLKQPIKVDRGTNISLIFGTHTAGTYIKSGVVTGFFEENPNA